MYALIFFTFVHANSPVFVVNNIPSKASCIQIGEELLIETKEKLGYWGQPVGKFICKAIPAK